MERRFDFNIVVEPCGILLFLIFCAASFVSWRSILLPRRQVVHPPISGLRLLPFASLFLFRRYKVVRVQRPVCSPKTRRSRCRLIPLRHRSLLTSRPVRSLPLWLTVLAITDLSFPGATLLAPPPLCCIQCGGATRIPAGRGNKPSFVVFCLILAVSPSSAELA